jgi:phosphatidylglycerol:prolipoprotein diacylglycerol transferase
MTWVTWALVYPEFDPIAFSIGPFAVRWYALAYILGLTLGWQYCRVLCKRPPALLTPEAFDDFLLWATIGVVLGGRFGYILFYKPDFYLDNPAEILKIWRGGMSFHGGMLGVFVAIGLFARRRGVSYFAVADVIAAAAPIGLFLGRIANFINGELYGRVTDGEKVPWAMAFPGGGPLPRHPSQIYESLTEGALLFVIMYFLIRRGALERAGLLSGVFLIGYGLARIFSELFRQPDAHLDFVLPGISMGQVLSLPMVFVGLALLVWSRRQGATAH